MTNEQAIDILKHVEDHLYTTFGRINIEPSLQAGIDKGIAALKLASKAEAAITDLEDILFMGGGNIDTCNYCSYNACYSRGGHNNCNPVWRGPHEESE